MKKFLIFVFCFWIFSSIYLNAYSATGHDQFTSIEFVDDGKLLVNMTSKEIEFGYKTLGKRKFWGWKHHYFTIKKEAIYVGEIIFAKANRSKQTIDLNYTLKETTTNERSIKVGGSLSGKFAGKIDQIDASLNATVSSDYTDTDTNTRVEDTSFKATIKPNRRVVFRVTGEALVTNGVSKYYVCGITFNKGSWEYIDVVTKYYELIEEEIAE
jgi:hypothetical protein